jgi:hypothetical protein
LDFQKVFPYYSFDKDKINLNLLRRFLYQNKIPSYYLYSQKMLEEEMEEYEKVPEKKKKFIAKDKIPYTRFDIIDFD